MMEYIDDTREWHEVMAMCLSCDAPECTGDCERRQRYSREIGRRRRRGKTYRIGNERHTMREWAELYGIAESTLHGRINDGHMTLEEALKKGRYRRLRGMQ